MEAPARPFHIDYASWAYVRFFTDDDSTWRDASKDGRASDIWIAATEGAGGAGFVSVLLREHSGRIEQVAETSWPLSWIVVRCVLEEGDKVYTFAEAKPWQVEEPDLLGDVRRFLAGKSQAKQTS